MSQDPYLTEGQLASSNTLFSVHHFPADKLLEALPVPLYVTDAAGRISFYNTAMTELWGGKPELGSDLWCGPVKLFAADGQPVLPHESPLALTLKTGNPVQGMELLLERPDGTRRVIVAYPAPLTDAEGKITGGINIVWDSTERRQREDALRESAEKYRQQAASLENSISAKTWDLQHKNEALRESEERYHKMVEEVEDYAIILLDENGIVQNWNRGAERIKGYKEQEIIGKSFETFYLPDDRQRGLPHLLLEEARTRGKAVYEGWRLRKDGTRFWGSVVLTALHDDNNHVIGFSKVTRDLTERKLAEDRLNEYNHFLQLQNKELEQFAYAASHDMKEPLRKIIFYNSQLAERMGDRLADKEKEFLQRSIQAAQRMKLLIDDLLEYSKTSVADQKFEAVDLNGIADEVLLNYKDVLEQENATVRVSRLPVVQGIAFQLRQLFDNLLSNALKYRHAQRKPLIGISAQKVKGTTVPGLSPEKEYHQITFQDNGIGFENEYAAKIFELFQRLHPSAGSGTGVGLALCKKIVQNHQGAIRASGKLDVGACFEVFLPA